MIYGPAVNLPGSLKARLDDGVFRLKLAAIARRLRSLGAAPGEEISTWTTKHELVALHDLARASQGKVAVEIGAYLGAASRYIVAGLAAGGGRLLCVDTWRNETMPEGERDTMEEFARNVRGLERWITPLRKRGGELERADLPGPLDFVFIDADHSYESVRDDFAAVAPLLAPGAVVAFHDATNHPGVSRLVGELLAGRRWAIGGCVQTLVWLVPAPWLAEPSPGRPTGRSSSGTAPGSERRPASG